MFSRNRCPFRHSAAASLMVLLASAAASAQCLQIFPVSQGGRIPANPGTTTGTATFTFDVTLPPSTLVDLTVRLDIVHTWTEDLRMTLTPPGGTPIALVTHRGGVPAFGDFDGTLLRSSAAVAIGAGPPGAAPPFVGSFRPESPFTPLLGTDPAGTWTLTITDIYFGDYGRLYGEGDAAFETRRPPMGGTSLEIITLPAAGYPANVRFAGLPGMPPFFPDIQAAHDASAPGDVVVVAPGIHPSFQVTKALRILPCLDGTVTIDTTAGPVGIQVAATSSSSAVVLAGMTVGSPGVPGPAIAIQNATALVVLDALEVAVAAPADALVATASTKVLLQDVTLPGTLRAVQSRVEILDGSVPAVVALQGSHVRHGGLAGVGVQTDPSSTAVAVAGTFPDLGFPRHVRLGQAFPMVLRGEPFAPWFLGVAAAFDDFALPGIEMRLHIDVPTLGVFAAGAFDANGDALLPLAVPPEPALAGLHLPFQALAAGAAGGRLSETRELLILP